MSLFPWQSWNAAQSGGNSNFLLLKVSQIGGFKDVVSRGGMMRTTVVPQKPGISQEKFEELYREHYQMVYRAAYKVTRRKEDAEDALQSVFTNLAQQGFRT